MDELGGARQRLPRARLRRVQRRPGRLVTGDQVAALLDAALAYVDASLRANRREDGLYHSYNILDLADGGRADPAPARRCSRARSRCSSSGRAGRRRSPWPCSPACAPAACTARTSTATLLYPDKDLAGLPRAEHASRPVGRAVLPAGRRPARGGGPQPRGRATCDGDLHFAAGIRNARDVQAALDRLAADPDLARGGRRPVAPSCSTSSRRSSPTASSPGAPGRSSPTRGWAASTGTWCPSCCSRCRRPSSGRCADGEPSATVAGADRGLRGRPRRARLLQVGRGLRRLPDRPLLAHAGRARCPPARHDRTGEGGDPHPPRRARAAGRGRPDRVPTRPAARDRVAREPGDLRVRRRPRRRRHASTCRPGSLAFTFCQVPVVYRQAEALRVRVVRADGTAVECPDGRIPADLSASIFGRTRRRST